MMSIKRTLARAVLAASLFTVFGAMPESSLVQAQTKPVSTHPPGQYDPVADPHAVVTVGYTRFTVLTPQLIRMEWAADGKFEDHASFVFLNRNLPVPKFTHEVTQRGANAVLTIKTDSLTLTYTSVSGKFSKFDAENLQV